MVTPAPLVEWGFHTEVLTPNCARARRVKLPIELAFKEMKGGFKEIKSGDPGGTWLCVNLTYLFNNVQGQISGLLGKLTKLSHCGWRMPFLLQKYERF